MATSASPVEIPATARVPARPASTTPRPPGVNGMSPSNDAATNTMWLGRAHSIGHTRQLLNLIGFAITVNALALKHHRERRERLFAA